MKERIKELADQAGVRSIYFNEAGNIQKFAELIVREYESQIQLLITRAEKENTRLLAGNGEYSGKLAVPVDQLTKIKQHFGVEG